MMRMSFNAELTLSGCLDGSGNVIAKRNVEIVRKFTSASGRVITVLLGLRLKYSEIETRHVRN